MSLMIALCPLVIAMSVSATSASLGILVNRRQNTPCELPVLTTRFADEALLKAALNSHGLTVSETGDDAFTVATAAGELRYSRTDRTQPYQMEARHVKDLPKLLDQLEALNRTYGMNVQQYTRDLVLSGLNEHGMRLDSETVLEDDSILLTISI